MCVSQTRLLTYSGNCVVLYWNKFSCHKSLFSEKQTSQTNLYILAPEGKTKNTVYPTTLQWHFSHNITLQFCYTSSFLHYLQNKTLHSFTMLSSFPCTFVCLRKFWSLSWVTWRTFYSDTRPQIILSFTLYKKKILSGFAIGHPGQRRVPLLVCMYTGYTQKNGTVSKVNKKFISRLTRAQRTPSVAATVQASHALTLGRLISYIYGAPILDVSRSHTTTQHSR